MGVNGFFSTALCGGVGIRYVQGYRRFHIGLPDDHVDVTDQYVMEGNGLFVGVYLHGCADTVGFQADVENKAPLTIFHKCFGRDSFEFFCDRLAVLAWRRKASHTDMFASLQDHVVREHSRNAEIRGVVGFRYVVLYWLGGHDRLLGGL